MKISVVIPTRNRIESLSILVRSLEKSTYPITELIIVDASDNPIKRNFLQEFKDANFCIRYFISEPSVCKQRNLGISRAISDWVFICDDDIEIQPDYLEKLVKHQNSHPDLGVVCGRVLQLQNGQWLDKYNLNSKKELIFKFIFQLGIWGNINIKTNDFLIRRILRYYKLKGNHISKAGWPVLISFGDEYFDTPIFGLGASLIRKQWLLNNPFDENLDNYGIGDNYELSLKLTPSGIRVVNSASVYHHKSDQNRQKEPTVYYKRVLALDYIIKLEKNNPQLLHVRKLWLIWSLMGNLLLWLRQNNLEMVRCSFKIIRSVIFLSNPYWKLHKNKK